MALLFELAAEIGTDRAAAERFARFFDGTRWQLPGTPCFETTVGAEIATGESGRYWVCAVPSGLSTSGVRGPEDARQMTEVGFLLYEKLQSAPPYRFASVAIEAFVFRDVEDLPAILLPHSSSDGLVLSESLWMSFGQPAIFVPFAPGYRWRPYRGEQE